MHAAQIRNNGKAERGEGRNVIDTAWRKNFCGCERSLFNARLLSTKVDVWRREMNKRVGVSTSRAYRRHNPIDTEYLHVQRNRVYSDCSISQ